jgi:hypothetical protein
MDSSEAFRHKKRTARAPSDDDDSHIIVARAGEHAGKTLVPLYQVVARDVALRLDLSDISFRAANVVAVVPPDGKGWFGRVDEAHMYMLAEHDVPLLRDDPAIARAFIPPEANQGDPARSALVMFAARNYPNAASWRASQGPFTTIDYG